MIKRLLVALILLSSSTALSSALFCKQLFHEINNPLVSDSSFLAVRVLDEHYRNFSPLQSLANKSNIKFESNTYNKAYMKRFRGFEVPSDPKAAELTNQMLFILYEKAKESRDNSVRLSFAESQLITHISPRRFWHLPFAKIKSKNLETIIIGFNIRLLAHLISKELSYFPQMVVEEAMQEAFVGLIETLRDYSLRAQVASGDRTFSFIVGFKVVRRVRNYAAANYAKGSRVGKEWPSLSYENIQFAITMRHYFKQLPKGMIFEEKFEEALRQYNHDHTKPMASQKGRRILIVFEEAFLPDLKLILKDPREQELFDQGFIEQHEFYGSVIPSEIQLFNQSQLKRYFNRLKFTDQEIKVLLLRFLVSDLSQRETGREMNGLSGGRIQQIESKALNKLRSVYEP